MRSNKGFTLIELLAVIVVLAIIALITVPQILGMTSSAKNQASMRSVEGHIRNIDNSLAMEAFSGRTVNGVYSFDELDLKNYPERDEVRCDSYEVKDNVVVKALDCTANQLVYCYNGTQAKDCSDIENNSGNNENQQEEINNIILTDNSSTKDIIIPDSVLKRSSDESPIEYQNGLFKALDVDGKYSYYYRGNVNNFLKIGNDYWRIIKVNSDGTIRLISEYQQGSSKYSNTSENVSDMYYATSNIKTAVDNWYQTHIANNASYQNIVTTGVYCQALKIDYIYDNYKDYIPSYSCPDNDGNANGKLALNVGMITLDELMMAGGGINDFNENFYLNNYMSFWTMSPAGISTNSRTNTSYSNVWHVTYEEDLMRSEDYFVEINSDFRPVINIKKDVNIVKEYDSFIKKDIYVVK